MTDEFLVNEDGIDDRNAEGRVVCYMTTNKEYDMHGNPAGDFKKTPKQEILILSEENCFSC
ncbi:hypothetical protein KAJ89_00925 [Candidatus Parcubacteria bacterium]|nr:hypothetical protein [Candidatus Parcubacteria bacterium]